MYWGCAWARSCRGLTHVTDESQMTNRIAARMSQITVSSSPMPSPATGTLRGAVRARHGTVSAAFSKPPPQVSTVVASDSDYINRCFTLMDWSGENVIAEDLPVPNQVIWEKNNSFCAMIYDEYFCTFELRYVLKRTLSRCTRCMITSDADGRGMTSIENILLMMNAQACVSAPDASQRSCSIGTLARVCRIHLRHRDAHEDVYVDVFGCVCSLRVSDLILELLTSTSSSPPR